MRQSTYMNVVLTVITVLLGGLLWMQIAGKPLFAQSADADGPRQSVMVPNAAAQRAKLIVAMDKVQQAVTASQKMLESGKVKVTVTNLGEIKIPKSP